MREEKNLILINDNNNQYNNNSKNNTYSSNFFNVSTPTNRNNTNNINNTIKSNYHTDLGHNISTMPRNRKAESSTNGANSNLNLKSYKNNSLVFPPNKSTKADAPVSNKNHFDPNRNSLRINRISSLLEKIFNKKLNQIQSNRMLHNLSNNSNVNYLHSQQSWNNASKGESYYSLLKSSLNSVGAKFYDSLSPNNRRKAHIEKIDLEELAKLNKNSKRQKSEVSGMSYCKDFVTLNDYYHSQNKFFLNGENQDKEMYFNTIDNPKSPPNALLTREDMELQEENMHFKTEDFGITETQQFFPRNPRNYFGKNLSLVSVINLELNSSCSKNFLNESSEKDAANRMANTNTIIKDIDEFIFNSNINTNKLNESKTNPKSYKNENVKNTNFNNNINLLPATAVVAEENSDTSKNENFYNTLESYGKSEIFNNIRLSIFSNTEKSSPKKYIKNFSCNNYFSPINNIANTTDKNANNDNNNNLNFDNAIDENESCNNIQRNISMLENISMCENNGNEIINISKENILTTNNEKNLNQNNEDYLSITNSNSVLLDLAENKNENFISHDDNGLAKRLNFQPDPSPHNFEEINAFGDKNDRNINKVLLTTDDSIDNYKRTKNELINEQESEKPSNNDNDAMNLQVDDMLNSHNPTNKISDDRDNPSNDSNNTIKTKNKNINLNAIDNYKSNNISMNNYNNNFVYEHNIDKIETPKEEGLIPIKDCDAQKKGYKLVMADDHDLELNRNKFLNNKNISNYNNEENLVIQQDDTNKNLNFSTLNSSCIIIKDIEVIDSLSSNLYVNKNVGNTELKENDTHNSSCKINKENDFNTNNNDINLYKNKKKYSINNDPNSNINFNQNNNSITKIIINEPSSKIQNKNSCKNTTEIISQNSKKSSKNINEKGKSPLNIIPIAQKYVTSGENSNFNTAKNKVINLDEKNLIKNTDKHNKLRNAQKILINPPYNKLNTDKIHENHNALSINIINNLEINEKNSGQYHQTQIKKILEEEINSMKNAFGEDISIQTKQALQVSHSVSDDHKLNRSTIKELSSIPLENSINNIKKSETDKFYQDINLDFSPSNISNPNFFPINIFLEKEKQFCYNNNQEDEISNIIYQNKSKNKDRNKNYLNKNMNLKPNVDTNFSPLNNFTKPIVDLLSQNTSDSIIKEKYISNKFKNQDTTNDINKESDKINNKAFSEDSLIIKNDNTKITKNSYKLFFESIGNLLLKRLFKKLIANTPSKLLKDISPLEVNKLANMKIVENNINSLNDKKSEDFNENNISNKINITNNESASPVLSNRNYHDTLDIESSLINLMHEKSSPNKMNFMSQNINSKLLKYNEKSQLLTVKQENFIILNKNNNIEKNQETINDINNKDIWLQSEIKKEMNNDDNFNSFNNIEVYSSNNNNNIMPIFHLIEKMKIERQVYFELKNTKDGKDTSCIVVKEIKKIENLENKNAEKDTNINIKTVDTGTVTENIVFEILSISLEKGHSQINHPVSIIHKDEDKGNINNLNTKNREISKEDKLIQTDENNVFIDNQTKIPINKISSELFSSDNRDSTINKSANGNNFDVNQIEKSLNQNFILLNTHESLNKTKENERLIKSHKPSNGNMQNLLEDSSFNVPIKTNLSKINYNCDIRVQKDGEIDSKAERLENPTFIVKEPQPLVNIEDIQHNLSCPFNKINNNLINADSSNKESENIVYPETKIPIIRPGSNLGNSSIKNNNMLILDEEKKIKANNLNNDCPSKLKECNDIQLNQIDSSSFIKIVESENLSKNIKDNFTRNLNSQNALPHISNGNDNNIDMTNKNPINSKNNYPISYLISSENNKKNIKNEKNEKKENSPKSPSISLSKINSSFITSPINSSNCNVIQNNFLSPTNSMRENIKNFMSNNLLTPKKNFMNTKLVAYASRNTSQRKNKSILNKLNFHSTNKKLLIPSSERKKIKNNQTISNIQGDYNYFNSTCKKFNNNNHLEAYRASSANRNLYSNTHQNNLLIDNSINDYLNFNYNHINRGKILNNSNFNNYQTLNITYNNDSHYDSLNAYMNNEIYADETHNSLSSNVNKKDHKQLKKEINCSNASINNKKEFKVVNSSKQNNIVANNNNKNIQRPAPIPIQQKIISHRNSKAKMNLSNIKSYATASNNINSKANNSSAIQNAEKINLNANKVTKNNQQENKLKNYKSNPFFSNAKISNIIKKIKNRHIEENSRNNNSNNNDNYMSSVDNNTDTNINHDSLHPLPIQMNTINVNISSLGEINKKKNSSILQDKSNFNTINGLLTDNYQILGNLNNTIAVSLHETLNLDSAKKSKREFKSGSKNPGNYKLLKNIYPINSEKLPNPNVTPISNNSFIKNLNNTEILETTNNLNNTYFVTERNNTIANINYPASKSKSRLAKAHINLHENPNALTLKKNNFINIDYKSKSKSKSNHFTPNDLKKVIKIAHENATSHKNQESHPAIISKPQRNENEIKSISQTSENISQINKLKSHQKLLVKNNSTNIIKIVKNKITDQKPSSKAKLKKQKSDILGNYMNIPKYVQTDSDKDSIIKTLNHSSVTSSKEKFKDCLNLNSTNIKCNNNTQNEILIYQQDNIPQLNINTGDVKSLALNFTFNKDFLENSKSLGQGNKAYNDSLLNPLINTEDNHEYNKSILLTQAETDKNQEEIKNNLQIINIESNRNSLLQKVFPNNNINTNAITTNNGRKNSNLKINRIQNTHTNNPSQQMSVRFNTNNKPWISDQNAITKKKKNDLVTVSDSNNNNNCNKATQNPNSSTSNLVLDTCIENLKIALGNYIKASQADKDILKNMIKENLTSIKKENELQKSMHIEATNPAQLILSQRHNQSLLKESNSLKRFTSLGIEPIKNSPYYQLEQKQLSENLSLVYNNSIKSTENIPVTSSLRNKNLNDNEVSDDNEFNNLSDNVEDIKNYIIKQLESFKLGLVKEKLEKYFERLKDENASPQTDVSINNFYFI